MALEHFHFWCIQGNRAQSQTVIVTAALPLIDTNDASLAGLVSEQHVQTLPLNGRSILNLVMLQPGMAQDNNGSMGWLSPQSISNGNQGKPRSRRSMRRGGTGRGGKLESYPDTETEFFRSLFRPCGK